MNEIKKSFCIDYFKFRVDGLIDIPKSQEEYINDSNGNIECDFSFINELCKILLIKPYQHYDNDPGWQGYKFFSIFDEDIAIFGGRKSEESEDNNIPRCFVELKGHALRMFELRCIDNGIDVLYGLCNAFSQVSAFVTVPQLHGAQLISGGDRGLYRVGE